MFKQNKYNELFGDMPSLGFPNLNKIQANSVNNNNVEYHDDYADFTEIEDENGKIMLIKYSGKYEFRGNDYCIYTLCDEKTGSREEGIAQIKGGQYVRLTDPERIEKIRASITDQQNRMINKSKELPELTYIKHKIYYGDVYILLQVEGKYHIFDSKKGSICHEGDDDFETLNKKLFKV